MGKNRKRGAPAKEGETTVWYAAIDSQLAQRMEELARRKKLKKNAITEIAFELYLAAEATTREGESRG